MADTAFEVLGPAPLLAIPVILSVPHAGRAYPANCARLCHPVARLISLEDRYADLLATLAVREGTTALVARLPRLWIDLNRAEHELDEAMVEGGIQSGRKISARARGGLGLIPRRVADISEIWCTRLPRNEVAHRLDSHHRPYHATLAALLDAAVTRFGAAVLIDLHSMPGLGKEGPDIVIGDRFGSSAAPRLAACAEAVFLGAGLRVASNAPYAGGHIVSRHGNPRTGIHALQIEVDRRLYLDEARDAPGPGLARMQGVIAQLVRELAAEIVPDCAIAAE